MINVQNRVNLRDIGRSATLVVAASDSQQRDKADYICDGVDDQEQIQDAINTLPASGGEIFLLEGTFNISPAYSSFVAIDFSTSFVSIRGSGESTVLSATGDINSFQLHGGTGGGWYYPEAQSGVVFADICFTADNFATGVGIRVDGPTNHLKIHNCYLKDMIAGIDIDGQSHAVQINDNFFEGNKRSIRIEEPVHDIRICNNKENGLEHHGYTGEPTNFLRVSSGELFEGVISANSIEHIHNTINTGKAIYFASAVKVADIIIANNSIETCDYGVYAELGYIHNGQRLSNLLINGNSFREDASSHIFLSGSGTCLINGNNFIAFTGGAGVAIQANDFTGIVTPRENFFTGFGAAKEFKISGTSLMGVYNYGPICSDIFMDVVAKSANAVHVAITGTGAELEVTTAITNPDVPRNISITNSANSTGDVVITGIDAKGNSVTDTIAIVTGGIAYGVVAFASVSKITIPATVANPDTITVGISDKLGLSNILYTSGDVYKVKVNNADDPTIGTVNTTYGTVNCATINAADDLTIWYKSNLNIIS
jgi:hypothetical protein